MTREHQQLNLTSSSLASFPAMTRVWTVSGCCAIALFALLFFPLRSMAQGEADIWYFGHHAGLDFNSGSPVAIGNSAMSQSEGSASISDPNGNLLFYTDGVTVWNKNHQVMTNGTGLMGHASSTQSALIVPKPSSPNIYYIFTTSAGFTSLTIGMRYSVVDMTLQSGLGAVTSTKNVLVEAGMTAEKLAAIDNGSGTGYWILCPRNTPAMRAFEVTAAGVNTTPVISNMNGSPALVGQLKVSPNGSWLAMGGEVNGGSGIPPRLAKFDKNTGQVTDDIALPTVGFYTYGVEFSAGSNFLYTNNTQVGGVGPMYQFDLSLGSLAAIASGVVNIGPTPSLHQWALQLGPDHKIYTVGQFSNTIGVINYPDSAGVACGMQGGVITLPNGTNGIWGLPNFVQSLFSQIQYDVFDTCMNDSTTFDIVNQNVDSVLWDFGDTASGAANLAQGLSVTHVFSSSGTYNAIAKAYFLNNNGFLTFLDSVIDTLVITIHPVPQVDLGPDTMICEGGALNIVNNTSFLFDYLWSDSSTAQMLPIFAPDTYYVQVSNICGVAYDTIVIDSIIPAFVDLGPDSLFCGGDTVFLDPNLPAVTYVWQNNNTNPIHEATSTGWYSVTTTGVCGVDEDSVYYTFVAPPTTNMPDDTVLCDGNSALLEVVADNASILWQDGSTLDNFLASQPGSFSVVVTGPCGVFYDSTFVQIDLPMSVDLGNDTVICEGSTYWLPAHVPERVSLFWSDSTTVDSFYIDKSQIVWVIASNACNVDIDSLLVEVEEVPEVALPEDTIFCDGDTLEVDVTFSRAQYLWSHGPQSAMISLTQQGGYSVTVANLCGQDTAFVNVRLDSALSIDLGGPYGICKGDSVQIETTAPNQPSFLWNIGAVSSSVMVSDTGHFTVTVTNTCGGYTGEADVFLKEKAKSYLPSDTLICSADPWEITLFREYADVFWPDGTSSEVFQVDTSGTYWLSMQNSCGWTTDTFDVRFSHAATLDLGVDTFVCLDVEPLILVAGDADGLLYSWQDGSQDSLFEVTESGNYFVEVTDPDGCFFEDDVFVGVCPMLIWIPSAFSPNSDQLNDVFLPLLDYVTDYEFIIYDRWGHKLFVTNNPVVGWDGTAGNRPMPDGVYTYAIQFKSDYIGSRNLRGSVTLIR